MNRATAIKVNKARRLLQEAGLLLMSESMRLELRSETPELARALALPVDDLEILIHKKYFPLFIEAEDAVNESGKVQRLVKAFTKADRE